MTTAPQTPALHDIIKMERAYKTAPARVFAAWADAKARQRWGSPGPDEIIVYDKADFRVGGEDISRCGPQGDLRYRARVRYMEIIADARIVMAEHVSESGVSRAAALITVELEPVGAETTLKLTMQIFAFDAEMTGGYQMGWTAALDNLAKEF